jgi:hypothetical protein
MPIEDYPSFPFLPKEYMQEIGRVVLCFNCLESSVKHTLIIATLGKFANDRRVESLVTNMNFSQMLDILPAVLKLTDKEAAEIYASHVQPLLRESLTKRNATVHHTWYNFADGVRRLSIKAKGELKTSLTDLISIEDVRGVSDYIMKAHSELLNRVTLVLCPTEAPQQGQ